MKIDALNLKKRLIRTTLPKGWKLNSINSKEFKVTCPFEDRFEVDSNVYDENVERIETMTDSKCTGGGYFIGSDIYDIYFAFN